MKDITRKIVGIVLMITSISLLYYLTFVRDDFSERRTVICGEDARVVENVAGESMQPYSYGFVVQQPITFKEVEVGDVISYINRDSDLPYTHINHAVIRKYEDYLVTRGYNNLFRDKQKVLPEDVVGINCVHLPLYVGDLK